MFANVGKDLFYFHLASVSSVCAPLEIRTGFLLHDYPDDNAFSVLRPAYSSMLFVLYLLPSLYFTSKLELTREEIDAFYCHSYATAKWAVLRQTRYFYHFYYVKLMNFYMTLLKSS